MATRGSALSRALTFFREGQIDEVRVAFTLAKEIVERRLEQESRVAPNLVRAKRTRKPKSKRSSSRASPSR